MILSGDILIRVRPNLFEKICPNYLSLFEFSIRCINSVVVFPC